MHLVIGFIASALMAARRRSPARSPLLELSYPIRTLHLLPGRVRFEVPVLAGRQTAAKQLETKLGGLQGVQSIRVTPAIGTITITFDQAQLQAELLVAAIVRLLGLEKEMEKAPQSTAAREIRATATALDRAVFDQTRGMLDLRTAVPLALAGLGAYRLLTRQGAALPTGATLLWWAYSAMRTAGRGAPPDNAR
jgi:copper chaperone CopZ